MKKEALLRPFPAAQVKTRTGNGGKQLHYLATASVIERLNEASEHMWSFEVVRYELLADEVIVTGKLTLDGVVKMDIGSSSITRDSSGKEISVGDDTKSGVSDCIKRCARLFGIGLELYGAATPAAAPRSEERPAPRAAERLTSRQLAALQSACRRKGWAQSNLTSLVGERFGKGAPEALTRSEASSLISELTGSNGH